jgi:atypical dual specificity phosphatase
MNKKIICDNNPKILIINCVWNEEMPNLEKVIKLYALIPIKDEFRNLFQISNKKKKFFYSLTHIILYSSALSHYIIAVYHPISKIFYLVDDNMVIEFKKFVDLISSVTANLLRNNEHFYYYPVLLIYSNSEKYDQETLDKNQMNEEIYNDLINQCNKSIQEYKERKNKNKNKNVNNNVSNNSNNTNKNNNNNKNNENNNTDNNIITKKKSNTIDNNNNKENSNDSNKNNNNNKNNNEIKTSLVIDDNTHGNNVIVDINKNQKIEKAYASVNRLKNLQNNLARTFTKKECETCHKQIETHLYKIHCNAHPTEIFRWLFLGTFENACDINELKRIRVTHILNCASECKNTKLPSNIKELHLNINDYEGFEIFDYFDEANEFLHNCKENVGIALVHCKYGISRSVAFIIAYLIKYLKFSADSALEYLMQKRSKIKPNDGFMDQLREYERMYAP